MKHLKKYNESLNKTKEEVVSEYTEKHDSVFFSDFLKRYPTSEVFNDRLPGFTGYDDDEEFESPEEAWHPEGEVYMLDSDVGNYPGDEVWVDFYNDMLETDWDNGEDDSMKHLKRFNESNTSNYTEVI